MTNQTPVQLKPTPRHRRGDLFDYSFQFSEDENPLDLSAFDSVTVKLFSDDITVFEHVSGDTATISGSDNNIIGGLVDSEQMNANEGSYFLDVFRMLNGRKRTLVSSPFIIKGPGKSGTSHEWTVEIINPQPIIT